MFYQRGNGRNASHWLFGAVRRYLQQFFEFASQGAVADPSCKGRRRLPSRSTSRAGLPLIRKQNHASQRRYPDRGDPNTFPAVFFGMIKGFLDDWYTNKSNLSNNNNLMSTTAGFCNDRSIASQAGLWNSDDTALGYGANVTYYGAYNRLVNNKEPQYACPNNSRDLFTTNGSNTGNAKLTNPIGLLSADEYAFLGGAYSRDVSNNFLKIDYVWFLGSPYSYYVRDGAQMYVVRPGDGGLVMDDFHQNIGVRPVINLKPSALVTRGTGISTDPYIIKAN